MLLHEATVYVYYAKQKHPGCTKKARPRRSSIVNGYICNKSFDINRSQEIIYQNPLSCLNDNSLQCILTTMIGFVTWPPFCTIIIIKVAK